MFLDEEVFGLIEPVFERQVPGFAHYGFVTVSKTTCRKVISDLDELAQNLTSVRSISEIPESIGFFYQNTEADFAANLAVNAKDLTNMIRELAAWLTEQLQKHECISVLGI
ncbi:MAG TPA: hypothetical protein VKS79_10245 [Gemmataceae bacterium]|nr:hypothetical protein [Gemmataceae bacterium]